MSSLPIEHFTRQDLLDYPGKRPEGNYFTDGEYVFDLPDSVDEAMTEVDSYLLSKNLPLLKDRIPVIAYGANANPSAMVDKMLKYITPESTIELDTLKTIPMFKATVQDSAAVWHGRPGQSGGIFAELYQGEEVKGEAIDSYVQMLTEEQLALLHTTEGATYAVSVVHDVEVGDHVISAIAYTAGESSILIDENKSPILVKGANRESEKQALTASEALTYIHDNEEVQRAVGQTSVAESIVFVKPLPLAERKARQNVIADILDHSGARKVFRHPASDTDMMGRTNFVSMPKGIEHQAVDHTAIELLETSVDRLRDADDKLIKVIRRQATTSLEDPHRERALREHTARQQAHDAIISKENI